MVACVRRSDDGSIEFLFSHVYICYIGVYAISITSSRSLKIQRKKPSMRMKRLPKQTMQNLMTSIQCLYSVLPLLLPSFLSGGLLFVSHSTELPPDSEGRTRFRSAYESLRVNHDGGLSFFPCASRSRFLHMLEHRCSAHSTHASPVLVRRLIDAVGAPLLPLGSDVIHIT